MSEVVDGVIEVTGYGVDDVQPAGTVSIECERYRWCHHTDARRAREFAAALLRAADKAEGKVVMQSEEEVKQTIAAMRAEGRCEICDLMWGAAIGQCGRLDAMETYNETLYGTNGWGTERTGDLYRAMEAERVRCRARRVDWRKRAIDTNHEMFALREKVHELQAARDNRQAQVFAWAQAAFGVDQATSLPQRGLRLLEEATEALQAAGGTLERAQHVVSYVFSRPPGHLPQELGGVSVCLLALAAAAGVSAEVEEMREVDRVLSRPLAEFTARNQAKNDAGLSAMCATAKPPPPLSCGCPAGAHPDARNYCEAAAERDGRICRLGWSIR